MSSEGTNARRTMVYCSFWSIVGAVRMLVVANGLGRVFLYDSRLSTGKLFVGNLQIDMIGGSYSNHSIGLYMSFVVYLTHSVVSHIRVFLPIHQASIL